MPGIRYIQPDGTSENFTVASALFVMQGAVNNNAAGIPAEWAGRLPSRQALEDSMRDDEDPLYVQLRLCCQLTVTPDFDGLAVAIAAA